MIFSKVYTYRNKKKVWFKIPKLINIKNKKQLDKLIDNLLDIDAVIEVEGGIETFPCVVEVLDNTFAPHIQVYKGASPVKLKEALPLISQNK